MVGQTEQVDDPCGDDSERRETGSTRSPFHCHYRYDAYTEFGQATLRNLLEFVLDSRIGKTGPQSVAVSREVKFSFGEGAAGGVPIVVHQLGQIPIRVCLRDRLVSAGVQIADQKVTK